MFKHYLKMAIRQILKNKIQYLLSIIGIAVGLLLFQYNLLLYQKIQQPVYCLGKQRSDGEYICQIGPIRL